MKLVVFILGLTAVTARAHAGVEIPKVDSLEVIAVTDNYYDMFQPEEKNASRFLLSKVPGLHDITVRGEMGLALVVKVTKDGVSHTIVFDSGLTSTTYANNLEKLKIDVGGADALVISHGHEDHWGGISVALDATAADARKNHHPPPPVYVGHEDAFLQHLFVTPTNKADMGTLDKATLTREKRQLIIADKPTIIAGVGLLTGFIPKSNTFEAIPPALKVVRKGVVENAEFPEEIALVFNVKDKGLVVLTGCSHRGVINATTYAQKITGISKVAGVVGGLHMTTASQATIDATVAAFKAMNVTYIMPMHCTGDRAEQAIRSALAAAYVHPSVGTTYKF